MVLLLLFCNISFKVCNNACIMPSFGKNYFINFYSVFLKMNDTVDFGDKTLYNFSGYQTKIFHLKSSLLIVLCLVLTNILFSTIFTQWFKGKLFH